SDDCVTRRSVRRAWRSAMPRGPPEKSCYGARPRRGEWFSFDTRSRGVGMSERFASQSAAADHSFTSDDVPAPAHRLLQIYAFDPSLDLDLETARVNRSSIPV